MQARIINALNRTMYLVEMWDQDPTINGTSELYAALEEARRLAEECYNTHDVIEEEYE